MKGGTLILLLWTNISLSHILRLPECNNYDAKFSKISYHQRLIGNILKTLDFISLRKCLTKCMWHLRCQSVNFKRQNETCELLGNSLQSNLTGNVLSVPQTGWIHFETDYDEKTLGRWCSNGNNNPCNMITERCEDRCVGNYQCVQHGEQLQSLVQTATQSSDHKSGNQPAELAFDGLEDTHSCTNREQYAPHWIKATFNQRVFIEYVILVNRANLIGTEHGVRNDFIDFFTVLYIDGQSIKTKFGNTGHIVGGRKTMLCQKYADELYANQPVTQGPYGYMNIAEILIYGRSE
uniref:Apple domain-containing protein n=1 Tax=Clytia hemisphaerica TaxID=252671 RepID=A0A7M5WQY1_9CNID